MSQEHCYLFCVKVGEVPRKCGGWREKMEQTLCTCEVTYILEIYLSIDYGLFSSLSIFSQLKDHLTRDFVELNSRGRDIQEIIGDVFVWSKKD